MKLGCQDVRSKEIVYQRWHEVPDCAYLVSVLRSYIPTSLMYSQTENLVLWLRLEDVQQIS